MVVWNEAVAKKEKKIDFWGGLDGISKKLSDLVEHGH